jgi:hypothetical protein
MKKVSKKAKSKVGLTKGAQTLKKIVAKAKTIRSKSPGKKWTNCIKQAAKDLK